MSYLSPLARRKGHLWFLSRELTQDSRETPAGRCGEEEEGEQGGGVLLSQRGAAGSCKDVCSTHPCTSQQLGRPGVGIRGPQDQPRGGVWREVRLITAPQIPSLTSALMLKWKVNRPPPQPLEDLGD